MPRPSVIPMPTHIMPVLPRFGELDPYNHVNHAVYVSYFEAARCSALEDIGMSLPDLSERNVQIVATQLEMRFIAPATARDRLWVETEVVEIRRASSRWMQKIVLDRTYGGDADPGHDIKDEAVLVTGLVTAAVCDNAGKPRRPPPDLMEALTRLTVDRTADPIVGST